MALKYVGEKVIVVTKTKQEANEFRTRMHEHGYKWANNKPFNIVYGDVDDAVFFLDTRSWGKLNGISYTERTKTGNYVVISLQEFLRLNEETNTQSIDSNNSFKPGEIYTFALKPYAEIIMILYAEARIQAICIKPKNKAGILCNPYMFDLIKIEDLEVSLKLIEDEKI